MSDSLQPHGLQHTRLPYPSLSPRVCSDLCLLNRWCFLTISSSASPFSFCLQTFPASGSFPVSQLFSGQSIRASASASVLPMNIQGWFPVGVTGLIYLLSRVFSSTTIQKPQFFSAQISLWSNSHIHIELQEKVWKWKSLSCVWLFATPWTVAHQPPPSMGFFQTTVLEWVAISFSKGSSWPKDWTHVSLIAGRLFTREVPLEKV